MTNKTALQVSQEMDKLINFERQFESSLGKKLINLAIESKRKELDAVVYKEYINGILDPRD